MTSIFMAKNSLNGKIRYESLLVLNPKGTKAFDFNINDPEFKDIKKRENNKTFSYLAQELKNMKKEPKYKFEKLERENQLDIISKRKKIMEFILREHGSFYKKEIKPLIRRTSRIVDKIYVPYMN